MLSKKPKKSVNVWVSFVSKVIAKNFKTSPNLVTLDPIEPQ